MGGIHVEFEPRPHRHFSSSVMGLHQGKGGSSYRLAVQDIVLGAADDGHHFRDEFFPDAQLHQGRV